MKGMLGHSSSRSLMERYLFSMWLTCQRQGTASSSLVLACLTLLFSLILKVRARLQGGASGVTLGSYRWQSLLIGEVPNGRYLHISTGLVNVPDTLGSDSSREDSTL